MDTDDLVNRLPEPIRIRVKHVFTAVLSYIFEMLTTDNMLTVPPDLTYKAPFGDMEHDFGLGTRLIFKVKNVSKIVKIVHSDTYIFTILQTKWLNFQKQNAMR